MAKERKGQVKGKKKYIEPLIDDKKDASMAELFAMDARNCGFKPGKTRAFGDCEELSDLVNDWKDEGDIVKNIGRETYEFKDGSRIHLGRNDWKVVNESFGYDEEVKKGPENVTADWIRKQFPINMKNDPENAGKLAHYRLAVGPNHRYVIGAVNTRFDNIVYFIWDREQMDPNSKLTSDTAPNRFNMKVVSQENSLDKMIDKLLQLTGHMVESKKIRVTPKYIREQFANVKNNPAKVGRLAAKRIKFGESNRYSVAPIHTRSELVEWAIWDEKHPEGSKYTPVKIRKSDTLVEAIKPFMKNRKEKYANQPKEKYYDDDAITNTGNDLHKRKKAYKKVAGGDNPMSLEEGSDLPAEFGPNSGPEYTWRVPFYLDRLKDVGHPDYAELAAEWADLEQSTDMGDMDHQYDLFKKIKDAARETEK